MSGTTTTPGVYVFDYGAWSAVYPALATNVNEAQAQAYFSQAELYLDNSPCSPVRNVTRRGLLFGMLVAHIAALYLPASQGGNGGAVGRTANATRGSVSIGMDYANQPGSASWFNQTQYGAAFWAATMSLRQARYIPGAPQRPRIWP